MPAMLHSQHFFRAVELEVSMAGAGQLVAGSVDLVHLVALAFDGHGEPVSSRRAPAVPVATVPGQVVIWMVWCASAAGDRLLDGGSWPTGRRPPACSPPRVKQFTC